MWTFSQLAVCYICMYVVYREQSVGSLHKHSWEMEIETISAKCKSLSFLTPTSIVVWRSLPNLNATEKISQVAPATSTRTICNYGCSPINGLWNGNHHVVTSRLTTPFNETASMDRFSFAAREAARALGGFTLKAEQMKVVTSVLQGRLRKDTVLRHLTQFKTWVDEELVRFLLSEARGTASPHAKAYILVLSRHHTVLHAPFAIA